MKKFLIVFPYGLFLFLAFLSMSKPPVSWEFFNIAAAKQVLLSGLPRIAASGEMLLHHPPVTVYAIVLSKLVFGDAAWAMKIPGMFSVLLTGILLWHLAFELYDNSKLAFCAVLIYLTSPCVIQWSLSVDYADGTYLPLAFTGFALLWARTKKWDGKNRFPVLGAVFGASLLCRPTTALALPAAVFLCLLLEGISLKTASLFLGLLLTGIATFLAAYGGYCVWLSKNPASPLNALRLFLMPVRHIYFGNNSTAFTLALGAAGAVRFVFQTVLQMGPLLVLFFLGGCALRISALFKNRRHSDTENLVFALPLIIFFVFLLAIGSGGIKYHVPALPFISLAAARFLVKPGEKLPERECVFFSGLLFALFSLYYFVFVKDYLYIFLHVLPEAKLAGTLERALRIFMKTILLYILPVPVMFIFSRKLKHSFTALLFLLLVSSQTALDVTQGTSAYFTTFNYGTNMSDYMKAISLVKNVKSDSLILAPVEFAVAADGHVKLLHVPGREWDSAVRIRQILEKQRPSLFIYGLPTNSTEQIKIKYTQPILINFLLSRYRKHALGDFTVWQRKNGGFQ